ncbi:heterokaryon incompatibility protein-domain-containing protein [Biscogniauxia marginata]|nr:heterokaryon incompatibility protein-domain-containing protein [Biscogniauxia marginata]
MRLINTHTLDLEDFVGREIPRYAILSHTWEDGQEVSFQEWQDRQIVSFKTGYSKIQNACEQARLSDLDYIWVDTNCIDKSSSAELSEAINSMFDWYERSEVCFVYLADVMLAVEGKEFPLAPTSRRKPPEHSPLSDARWFTRGWTLQELLAPDKLIFVSGNWQEIGRIDKSRKVSRNHSVQQFIGDVSKVTGIGIPYLFGLKSRHEASIALRMSWAASRKTTRVEDTAYCLFGLFNINMPLLYGEGAKAFQRLQQEIMKVSTDQSIFAWEWATDLTLLQGEVSFIAPSPSCFAKSADFVQLEDRFRSIAASTFTLTNTGLTLRLSIHNMPRTGLAFALLECSHRFYSKIDEYRLCIPVRLGPKSADGTHMCERLEWPPLPLCIAFFSPELHQLHIPRKAPRPHTNFEGLPAEFIHRDGTGLSGCSVFLLFPPSKHPYTIRSICPSHSSRGGLKGMKYDTIGMFEFHSWVLTKEYEYVSAIVQIEHQNRTVWIHLKVCQDEHFVFKACRILKTGRRPPLAASVGIFSNAPWQQEYTMQDALSSMERRRSMWFDKEQEGDWLVEMGAQAVDSSGMVTVPVYINCGRAKRGDRAREGEVDLCRRQTDSTGGRNANDIGELARSFRNLFRARTL